MTLAKRPPGAIQRLGDSRDLRSRKSAFMATIERVALRPDTRTEGLLSFALQRGGAGLVGFLEIEDCPVVGCECGRRLGLVFRHLRQVSDMANLETRTIGRAGAFHVDGDCLHDPTALDGAAKRGIAAHLLGHR